VTSPPGKPLVSIVTAVRNGAATIERSIRSVLEQTYGPIEYIVIDGASSDGTTEIIRRYEAALAFWSSEPDRGISHAFNKGLARARGDLVGFLNADDWMEPDQIKTAIAALDRTGADFVFGDLTYHGPEGRPVHRVQGDPDYARVIDSRMPEVAHPTLLARRAIFDEIGGFDDRYRRAMDYDWLLRAHRAGFRGACAPGLVGHMSLSGRSDVDFVRALGEVRIISVGHGRPLLTAWSAYLFRVAKGGLQRLSARLLPRAAHIWLRRRVNRSYHPQS